MANICTTRIVVVDTLENLEKINKAIESHEVQENTDKGWGGNILRALGAEVNEHVCYGFIEYPGEIKPAKLDDDFESALKDYCKRFYNFDYPTQENGSTVMPHVIDAARYFFCLGKGIENLYELHLDCEDRWMRGEFVECLQEMFPGAAIYWMSEEPGCQYWRTNDVDGKYFPDRWVVITDEDWEYFTTEEDALEYLKENFDIDSLDDIEKYNENNEDGNTVTCYECEEEF